MSFWKLIILKWCLPCVKMESSSKCFTVLRWGLLSFWISIGHNVKIKFITFNYFQFLSKFERVNANNKLFNRFIRSDESRLRESISQLKTIRASIQSTIVEVEAIHSETSAATLLTSAASAASKGRLRQLEIEEAVMRQEMMARCQSHYKTFFSLFTDTPGTMSYRVCPLKNFSDLSNVCEQGQSLSANIRLGLKFLPRTNALA
jgi:hypothetical protein